MAKQWTMVRVSPANVKKIDEAARRLGTSRTAMLNLIVERFNLDEFVPNDASRPVIFDYEHGDQHKP